jgi:hypothetical protein
VRGPSGQAYHARAIETIRTGQRVLARNPQLAEADLPEAPVDPASWVNIHLRMAQATGDPLEITLLRPVEWLAAQLAESAALDAEYLQTLEEARGAGADRALTGIRSVIVSETVLPPALGGIPALSADQAPTTPWIFLALHELAAVGPAEVVRVEPCPPIEPGAGRLVTGTFSHHSGEVLDITVDGLSEPIGCTGAHPFWSEDRQDFIPARELVPGETLRTESGTLRQITRITPRRGPPVPVFNLEVDAEHVYYVSVDGVLVHNAYGGKAVDSGVQANKAAGDAVRDLIAAREEMALVEQSFSTVGGMRRVDVLKLGQELISIESKVGRTALDARVRQELARDWWLRRQGQVDRVVWEFSPSDVTGKVGPSKPLLEMLNKLGFEVRINTP